MILIALGANLASPAGPPAATLRAALARLVDREVEIRDLSHFYRTPAWPAGPPFVNAVANIKTYLQPVELLGLLHEIETEFGRMRSAPNAPRTLDLDMLAYDDQVMSDGLILPHPRLQDRSFVLVPLAEIAPGWRHPQTGSTAAQMLSRLPDRDVPRRLE